MYKKISLTVIFICFFNISNLFAQLSVTTIDLKYVLKNSLAAKHALTELNTVRENYQLEITKKNKSLEQQYNDLTKQARVLSESALKDKQKELMSNVTRLEKNVQIKQKKLQSDYLQSLSIIEKEIIVIVKNIAQEKKYNLVITKDNLLYSDKKLDISDQVVKVLNKNLPKIKLSNSLK
jgi:outer membrane protein